MKQYQKIILVAILLISILYYNFSSSGIINGTMRELAPEATEFELISGDYYKAYKGSELIGYIGTEQAIGYAGPIEVMTLIGTTGIVEDLIVTQNVETPSFFSRVMANGYLDKFVRKNVTDEFQVDKDIDGITNATYTSNGIANAVKKTAHNIAINQLSLEVPHNQKMNFPKENFIILGLIALTIVLDRFGYSKLRYITLLFGLIFIGFLQKSPISLGNIATIISGNIPSFSEIPFWFLMVIGLLVIIIVTGKNLYCYWLCPFGAIAEVTSKLGKVGGISYHVCPKKRQQLKYMRLIFAWGALVFGFLIGNPSISSYEIFAPVFALEGTSFQW
ncbi:MAG: FMN-binding protein, partial [Eubacteriales bacterium]